VHGKVKRKDGKQRAGGGGPCRAFIREENLNPFDPETNRRYKALSQEELEKYKKLGKEMADGHRARHQLGHSSQSAVRAGERLLKRQEFDAAVFARVQNLEVTVDAAATDMVSSTGDANVALQDARKRRRVEAAASKQHDLDLAKDLKTFAEMGLDHREALVGVIDPACKANVADMHRCPVHPDFETFEFRPNARELSERLLAQACDDRRFEKFLKFLETEWARKHATIMHDAAAPIDAKTETLSECQRAGICLCKNRDLKMFVSRLSAAIKAGFPRGSPLRHQLNDGEVVFNLSFSTADSDARPVEWFHIAYASWSPYMLGLQRLGFSGFEGKHYFLTATVCKSTL
jgi:hypothetical protein